MKSSLLQKFLLNCKRKIYQKDSVDRIPNFHSKTHLIFDWTKITTLLLFMVLGAQLNLHAQCPELAPDCYATCGVGLDDKDGDGVPDAMDLDCLLYTSPSPRDLSTSRMPSSA